MTIGLSSAPDGLRNGATALLSIVTTQTDRAVAAPTSASTADAGCTRVLARRQPIIKRLEAAVTKGEINPDADVEQLVDLGRARSSIGSSWVGRARRTMTCGRNGAGERPPVGP